MFSRKLFSDVKWLRTAAAVRRKELSLISFIKSISNWLLFCLQSWDEVCRRSGCC